MRVSESGSAKVRGPFIGIGTVNKKAPRWEGLEKSLSRGSLLRLGAPDHQVWAQS